MQKLLVVAGLAVAAQAMLVVPEVSSVEAAAFNALPFEAQDEASARTFDLACPSCPITINVKEKENGGIATVTDVPNHLEFRLAVEQGSDGDRLLLNDRQIFPSIHVPAMLDLQAEQVPESPMVQVAENGQRTIGYVLARHEIAADDEHKSALYEFTFEVHELDFTFVDGVSSAVFRVIKTAEDRLLIAQLEVLETEPTADECTTAWCRLTASAKDAMNKLKGKVGHGCHGSKAHGKARPDVEMQHDDGHGNHGKHHGHHGHHGAGRKHHHSWRQLFRNVLAHIVIPVLVGILAGITASLIGMMVGTFIIWVWRVFVRRQPAFKGRHCRRGRCHKAAQNEMAVAEEKSGLMENQEAPPAYEDEENKS